MGLQKVQVLLRKKIFRLPSESLMALFPDFEIKMKIFTCPDMLKRKKEFLLFVRFDLRGKVKLNHVSIILVRIQNKGFYLMSRDSDYY